MSTVKQLRLIVAEQARHQCGYCQTQEVVSGIRLTVEHLSPKALGGTDEIDNLWLSCRTCNEAKGVLTNAFDPETQQTVPLFNPRTQLWHEHFFWDQDSTHIIGKTAVGRATVHVLDLNNELRVMSRAIWVEAGFHPPKT